ncbi:raffinose/stachyose/melibiose transport system substrate-binding protein [Paenibacillus phyllosphaerae]|uniref:Raffinose/stachyose/melibiose transport system substrate-binding protein n=1 Tax=Paenibacillus phyllosphaerae TaxID=274593 RepID=A0A7W5FNG7_9BACL|nr:extracellular solute-binding protein [Paenibacillus phyllosphaerae]MBB3111295.1 raffinose/stachyose/melibiose transport system substrate-binding protein [Paenibacillus phyllosphaerae]
MKVSKMKSAGLVLASTMVLLSACGGNNNGNGNAGGNNTAGNTTTNAATENTTNNGTTTNAAADPVTLTMLVSGAKAAEDADFELETLPKLVKEKFPNVTLEVQKLPDEQYYTSVKAKLAAGEGPDIFLVFPNMANMGAIEVAKAGYAADLSGLSFWDNVSQAAKNDMSYEGKPYAVAKGMDILGTYYNKDLFAQAGITEIPKDWASFLAASDKLKSAGITPIVMGDKDPWVIQFGMYQLSANSVYPSDPTFDTKLQTGETALTDEKWVKTVNQYKELYDKEYVAKGSLGMASAQAVQQFVDGKAAMIFTGTWDLPGVTATGASEFERGFFSLPGNDAGQPVYASAATAAGYALNANSKNLEIGKQIFEYLYDGQSPLFQAWVESNPSISVFNGVELKNEIFKDVLDNIQSTGHAFYFSNQMWPAGVSDVMQTKFSEIIGGKKTTAEDVTKAMQDKYKELYKG